MDNQIHTPTNPNTSPPNNPNLLIGVTGSVAAIKLSVLLDELVPYFNIRVIVTQHVIDACHEGEKVYGQLGELCEQVPQFYVL